MSRRPRQTIAGALQVNWRELPSGCREWTAARNADGYGLIWQGNRSYVMAHRASYEASVGAIPAGMQLDHLCRNRACIRPDHLEPVTNRTNVLRGTGITAQNAVKTHCSQGHPFDEVNTYWRPDNARGCKTCRRATNRRLVEARRGTS